MSKHIRRLPPEVSSKIAAGEVIERPVSVVKELVENAIDASCGRIAVELLEGGRSMIKVSDDGTGIPASELATAVENYATSKITVVEDLMHVETLGFRGEALASIRAVSELTIRTRSMDDEIGREMRWRAAELVSDAPFAREHGTDVVVENLFFNMPARAKFLSTDSAELRRISAFVQSISLSLPRVSLTLKENGRSLLTLPAASPQERIGAVVGGRFFARMKSVDATQGRTRINGYVSNPDLTRGNRSMQYIFINGRYVKDRLIGHAARQAYQSSIPAGQFPLFVLFLEVAAEELDINVHPTKSEVKFKHEREIHHLVSGAVRAALRGEGAGFEETVATVYRSIFPGGPEGRAAERAVSADQSSFAYASEGRPNVAARGETCDSPPSLFDGGREEGIVQTERLYWQLHNSYILIQIRGGMVIVDQHAAHERILYNNAKRSLESGSGAVQTLLFPATLELTPEEYESFEKLEGLLPRVGFEVEPFGRQSIIVRGIPASARNWNEGALLQEILGGETAGPGTESFLRNFACKSAVKAGTRLTAAEMESLSDQLFATEYPFTCPHGRPTMLRVDLADLERRFQRTVKTR